MNARQQFWFDYYAEVVRQGGAWLDYSNERVQIQTFGLALEAAGPIRSRRCLDVGCGWGDFCRTLSALHAAEVTGVDIVPELIAEHTAKSPDIVWLCGTLQDPALIARLGSYAVAFLLEVLQYMPVAETLNAVWERLLPGGRIVAMVPNANCPIVSRTRARFDANYSPPTRAEIDGVVRRWPDLEQVLYRGLWFRTDQRAVPYDTSSWGTSAEWEAEPNRIQFLALKRGAPST